jgi:hypothetical protein
MAYEKKKKKTKKAGGTGSVKRKPRAVAMRGKQVGGSTYKRTQGGGR